MASEVDLLILGGGCAGLSLAMRLAELGEDCPRTRILEPRRNYVHDRTWCFWDDGSTRFAPLVGHRWRKLTVRSGGRTATVDCGATPYCMLPSDAFYAAALDAIAANNRIELAMGSTASSIDRGPAQDWRVETNHGECVAGMVVDTRPDRDRAARDAVLWQSFEGCEIECALDTFDSSSADLMDFQESEANDMRFTYVLPVSSRRALIETTVFGRFPLRRGALRGELDGAIERLAGGKQFEILRSEHGALPMGHMQTPVERDRSCVRVGLTSGGARASTGYAFQRIQRWADRCAQSLAGGSGLVGHAPDPALLRAMDRLFLCVLRTQRAAAPEMFLSMFQNVGADRIIRFLSDRGTLGDYASVASALPLAPFLKEIPAAFLRTPELQVAPLNPRLRLQGLIFCSAAAACIALTPQLRLLDPNLELIGMATLVLALGVPHGALDTVFAKNLYKVARFRDWVLFGAAYFVPTAMVVGLWLWAPLFFLAGFLVVSLVHFSGDPKAGTPLVVRLLYGGAIIVLPSLLHAEEVSRIFSLLVGAASAATVTSVLHAAAWPWLLATLLAASYRLPADRLSAAEIAAAALLATIAPPLIAFTVFFCLMHSARHVLRTVEYFADVSPRLLIASAAASTLGTIGFAAIAWFWLRDEAFDAKLMQLVFVGLAALTIPHMGIVERVRLSGWKSAAALQTS